ncbi:hypothetical protein P7K49_032544 [Saguinus oedipus]|uniref:Uncharacterized protein n=1 Tax=Saguinus oedipus TaxID=9490 RepID=A0ABQ9TYK1_SAGOE|nr:hypothetical protein P7K49_032544 [Saguinus oedipus]
MPQVGGTEITSCAPAPLWTPLSHLSGFHIAHWGREGPPRRRVRLSRHGPMAESGCHATDPGRVRLSRHRPAAESGCHATDPWESPAVTPRTRGRVRLSRHRSAAESGCHAMDPLQSPAVTPRTRGRVWLSRHGPRQMAAGFHRKGTRNRRLRMKPNQGMNVGAAGRSIGHPATPHKAIVTDSTGKGSEEEGGGVRHGHLQKGAVHTAVLDYRLCKHRHLHTHSPERAAASGEQAVGSSKVRKQAPSSGQPRRASGQRSRGASSKGHPPHPPCRLRNPEWLCSAAPPQAPSTHPCLRHLHCDEMGLVEPQRHSTWVGGDLKQSLTHGVPRDSWNGVAHEAPFMSASHGLCYPQASHCLAWASSRSHGPARHRSTEGWLLIAGPLKGRQQPTAQDRQDPGQTGPGTDRTRDRQDPGHTGPGTDRTRDRQDPGQTGPGTHRTRDTQDPGHTGPGTHRTRDTQDPGQTGPGTHRTRDTQDPGQTGPGTDRTRDRQDPGHTGPGTHRTRDRQDLGHTGPGTHRTRDTQDPGHRGPGTDRTRDRQDPGHTGPGTHRTRDRKDPGQTGHRTDRTQDRQDPGQTGHRTDRTQGRLDPGEPAQRVQAASEFSTGKDRNQFPWV